MDELSHLHGGQLHPDRLIAALAARQHGVVTFAQLRAAGLTGRQIERRVAAGRLHRVHRGVYAVGVAPHTERGRWMAATLACDGWLSHRSAAALWELWPNARSAEHVTVRRRGVRDRPGIVVHGVGDLHPREVRRHEAIPVTSPARTLLDLAGAVSPGQVAAALTEARVRRLVDDRAVRDVLARAIHHRGAPALRAAFAGPFTRSQLERRLLALVAGHGLPRPQVNARVGADEVDILYPGLAIELDGRDAHAARWTQDAAKEARLRAAGLVVLRHTWWDVVRDGARTADAIRRALD